MKILVSVVFYFFCWLCCFLSTGSDKKNLFGLRSYPNEVQQAIRKHPKLGKIAPQEKTAPAILSGNLLLFTAVFSVLGMDLKNALELNDFSTTFLFFLALGEGLGVFDLVIIDLLWWRNTKRIRFFFPAGERALPRYEQAMHGGTHLCVLQNLVGQHPKPFNNFKEIGYAPMGLI